MCPLEPWTGSDEGYCILHAEEESKPVDTIGNVINNLPQSISSAKLNGIDDGTDLDFEGVSLPNADFSDSVLEGVNFKSANLKGADFSGANLDEADFSENANLSDAEFKNSSCVKTDFTNSNIEGANFNQSTIIDANFIRVQGYKAIFRECTLTETDFYLSKLDRTNFRSATLQSCPFHASDLSEAVFVNSDIFGSDFMDSDLTGAKFSGSEIGRETSFGSRNLREYQADRLAEPQWILELIDLPRVADRGFGKKANSTIKSRFTESDTNEDTPKSPPQSPFERCYEWPLWGVLVRILSLYRILHRLKIRFHSSRISWSSPSNTHQKELEFLRQSEQVYSEIKTAYRAGASADEARKYNIREKEAQRKQFQIFGSWPRNAFLKRLMMYGEEPVHVFRAAIYICLLATVSMLTVGVRIGDAGSIISFWGSGPAQLETVGELFLINLRQLLSRPHTEVHVQVFSGVISDILVIAGRLLIAVLIFTLGRRAVS